MKFVVDGTVLANSINNAHKILGGKGDAVRIYFQNIKSRPGYIRLKGNLEGRYVVIEFPCASMEGAFKFSVDSERLAALANKRSTLEFSMEEDNSGVLSYRSMHTSYKGHVAVRAAAPIDMPKLDKDKGGDVSLSVKLALFSLFEFVSLKPMFVDRNMLLFIEVDAKGTLRVASSDDYHVGMVERIPAKDAERTKTESFCLPFQYVSIITSAFSDKSKIAIATDKGCMHIYNENVHIALPLIAPPAETDQSNPTMARIKDIFEKNSVFGYDKKISPIRAIFSTEVEPIKLIMDNMKGLKDENSAAADLLLQVRGSKLNLRMESKHGESNDALDIDNKGDAKSMLRLEPSVTRDVLDRVEGKCDFRFHGERLCVIEKSTKSTIWKYLIVGIHKKKDS